MMKPPITLPEQRVGPDPRRGSYPPGSRDHPSSFGYEPPRLGSNPIEDMRPSRRISSFEGVDPRRPTIASALSSHSRRTAPPDMMRGNRSYHSRVADVDKRLRKFDPGRRGSTMPGIKVTSSSAHPRIGNRSAHPRSSSAHPRVSSGGFNRSRHPSDSRSEPGGSWGGSAYQGNRNEYDGHSVGRNWSGYDTRSGGSWGEYDSRSLPGGSGYDNRTFHGTRHDRPALPGGGGYDSRSLHGGGGYGSRSLHGGGGYSSRSLQGGGGYARGRSRGEFSDEDSSLGGSSGRSAPMRLNTQQEIERITRDEAGDVKRNVIRKSMHQRGMGQGSFHYREARKSDEDTQSRIQEVQEALDKQRSKRSMASEANSMHGDRSIRSVDFYDTEEEKRVHEYLKDRFRL